MDVKKPARGGLVVGKGRSALLTAAAQVSAGLLFVVIDRQPLQVVDFVAATAHKRLDVVDLKARAWALVFTCDGARVSFYKLGTHSRRARATNSISYA